MEQQNVQVEEGISLMDIVRLLLSKVKVLILAVLIGCVVGGAFGFWRSHDVHYYGTRVEFYINPERPEDSTSTDGSQYGVYGSYGRHVMDNMVRLLEAESFIEYMILNGKSLPEKEYKGEAWATAAEETDYEFSKKLEDAKAVNIEEKVAVLAAAIEARSEASNAAKQAETDLNAEWLRLYSLKDTYGNPAPAVPTRSFNQKVYDENIKDNTDATYLNLKYLYQEKETADAALVLAQTTETTAQNAKNEADKTISVALDAWSKTAKYQKVLSRYKGTVSFSYLEDESDFEDANNLARSFIYVNVSVLNDEKFANELLDCIKSVVPTYIKQKMHVPSGYTGTNVQRNTRTDNIQLTNPGYTTSQTVKFAMLLGAGGLLLAAVVIIILDRSDKRLRDTEVITKKLNVPLLGIVPSIEELHAEQNNQKNTTEVK